MNLDQWFIWHRQLMMVTWALTITAFVLILLELNGISKESIFNIGWKALEPITV